MRPLVGLGLALCGFAGTASAADYTEAAQRLADLRADVEALSEQLSEDKDVSRTRDRALEAQTVELDVQISRQEMRLERLLHEEMSQREALSGADEDTGFDDAVTHGIDVLREQVQAGLPFRKTARLEALDGLRTDLHTKRRTPEQAASRLWALAEDERRLTRENALDRQVIPLDGSEVLVEVARIGMVALYWRATDGAVGQATKSGSDWTWVALDGADADNVNELFNQLGKGIRVGHFALPGVLDGAS